MCENDIAISLFCSSGIGDLGLAANGIETVIGCELIKERMDLFSVNNPDAKCFQGDIWNLDEAIVDYYRSHYDKPPFIILATPPCQGMSSNGMGKMLSNYRKGIRPKEDPRNLLIVPALKIISQLRPEWVIFENVDKMINTAIFVDDEVVNIVEYIKTKLGDDYVGGPNIIDCADYGVPQRRRRLISIFTRNEQGKKYFESCGTLMPPRTHDKDSGSGLEKWITVRDAIGNLPKLEACVGKNKDPSIELHRVPILDDKKMEWIKNTPEGQTAFNNQCINPDCMYDKNPVHGTTRNEEGINQANFDTPLYCEKCGALLPRPYVELPNGTLRIMKGYTSAYKRMYWDEPASTLTQNFQFACSDNKVHPDQNRVLSLYEGLILQTIALYDYKFKINGKTVKEGLIRDTIGESVPPLVIDMVCRHIVQIREGKIKGKVVRKMSLDNF